MNRHHKLLEEIGHLKDRERVLLSENDQLRRQLVGKKEQEKKKYDDLMVQYNMKREYEDEGLDSDGVTVKEEIKEEIKEEDDGLDKQGTSNNQVTVKTEWDHEEVEVEVKEEDEDEDRDIIIKREYVPAYIKTESSDVKIEIKEEIKEEDDDEDHDDDCECDRFVVKKEEVSDDDDNSMQLNHPLNEVVQSNLNPPMDTSSRDQLHTPTNSVCAPSPNEPMQLTHSLMTEQSVDQQVMAANDDQSQSTRVVQSSDAQANMDQVMSHENGSGDENDEDVGGDDEMSISANDNHDGSVVASNEPSTSARARSNRVTSKQSTASTARKLNKRKQSQPNRTGKRSKKTDEVNDDGEDIANEDREEVKVKMLYLNCTQSNCNVKLDSLDHLHDHLSTVHQLSPLRCFATNCNARFDEPRQIRDHIKLIHSPNTRFRCSVCHKEYDSQTKTYNHWFHYHLTGQFKCNFVNDCGEVTDTRRKMTTHQKAKHYSQLKSFNCTHPGCTSSFSCNFHLKQHQLIHLATNQFHCNWPKCSHRTNRRSNLVMHIRTQHFGLPRSVKAQKERNIVDLRDPNEYVRVVVDE